MSWVQTGLSICRISGYGGLPQGGGGGGGNALKADFSSVTAESWFFYF